MLTFISGNPGKLAQLKRHLHVPVEHRKLDLPEIQSLDPHEIVERKARAAYAILRSPVLVEDVSLSFHALNGLPGPLIKWFLQALGNKGLCRLLDSHEDRGATASVVFAYYDGKTYREFEASVEGTIATEPRGTNSFGWDATFIPHGSDKTWGDMRHEEQRETSMRRVALGKLHEFLLEHSRRQ